MRKLDPQSVRDDFSAESQALMEYFGRARRALEGDVHEKRDVSRLASTTFLFLVVYFERFLSDLFLSYLNRDFSQYQATLEHRIKQSAEEKLGHWARGRTSFQAVKHIKVTDLEGVVDPTGWNLTFKDGDTIKERAQEWLAPAHADRINALTEHDLRVIDTAKSIRNFLAHGSPSSKVRMNDALSEVSRGHHNQYLGRGAQLVHNVGAYLKAVFAGQRRITIYADRLNDIAGRM